MKLDKIIIFIIFTLLIGGFFYLISGILLPFISAIVIAYFLDPLSDRLEKYGLSRSASAVIILGVFMAFMIGASILLLPLLYSQFLSLLNTVPEYITIFTTEFYPQFVEFASKNGLVVERDFYSYLDNQTISDLFGVSGNVVNNVMQSGIVFINVLSLVFITPILIYYILKDWDPIIKKINQYLPSSFSTQIRYVVKEIDKTLSGYVHGQFNVCMILGIFYALGLSIAQLNFGFLIGFLTGVLSFIPYIGMFIGVTMAIIVALFQWGFDFVQIGIIAVIFIIGQAVESGFLTPKLVGEKIGLHPVWIIFGLFVFGMLFGFTGVLLAMPITAVCGVLIKFSMSEYKKHFVKV